MQQTPTSTQSMSLEVVCVKEEPEWDGECGVSEAAARAGLYAGHAVKDELVLGPECLQPPDIVYAFRAESVEECKSLMECSVKVEPISPTRHSRASRTGLRARASKGQAKSTLQPHKYVCDTCGKTFTNKLRLIKHIQLHPTQITTNQQAREKTHTCVCGQGFTHFNNYLRHKRIHTDNDKPFVCDICDKQFSRSEHLKDHIQSHSGERPYPCEICKKRFTRIAHLNNHKLTHTGQKPFTCNVCHKQFTRLGNLNTHERTHTGEKPYTCELCGKHFSHRSNLKIHKNMHAGIKPYSCEICKKRFSQHSGYTYHKKTHLVEEPFVCEICEKEFKYAKSLRLHSRIHTHTDDET